MDHVDTPPAAKKKHANDRPVMVWLPRDLARELDAMVAANCAGIPGAKPSRQAFVVRAIRAALRAEQVRTNQSPNP